MTDSSVKVADYVRTIEGARYEGEVRAVFETRHGRLRAVVEAIHQDFEETLHVYPVEQLEIVKVDGATT